jgi:hypothetical protein
MHALCALLAVLLDMPALRQNALIAIAVNAEVVPRLWFSHLKVDFLGQTHGIHVPA